MAELGDVLVVGSINVDLVARVARLPAPGETVTGGIFATHQGGKGANQAVAAARAGGAVTMVGAVGNDEYGRSALAELAAEGVDVSRVSVLDDRSTGVALIAVDERGENQIVVASGANGVVDEASVSNALAGYAPRPGSVALLSFELGDSAVLGAAKFAAAHGMRVVVNPAPARPLLPALVELAPILLPNEGEAAELTGLGNPNAAAQKLAAQTRAPVIVTIGPDGALLASSPDTVDQIPAEPVRVVDTTGAGDVFSGTFAACLAVGMSVADAARAAVKAASASVGVAGARVVSRS